MSPSLSFRQHPHPYQKPLRWLPGGSDLYLGRQDNCFFSSEAYRGVWHVYGTPWGRTESDTMSDLAAAAACTPSVQRIHHLLPGTKQWLLASFFTLC